MSSHDSEIDCIFNWAWSGPAGSIVLTLPMLRLYFCSKHKNVKIYEKHLNPVLLVFIWKLSLSTVKWVPICQGFGNFQFFLHHFVLAKLTTSSIRVNPSNDEATFVQSTRTQCVLKTISTQSCWSPLDSSRVVLSDEYPYARISVIFQVFCIILYWPN